MISADGMGLLDDDDDGWDGIGSNELCALSVVVRFQKTWHHTIKRTLTLRKRKRDDGMGWDGCIAFPFIYFPLFFLSKKKPPKKPKKKNTEIQIALFFSFRLCSFYCPARLATCSTLRSTLLYFSYFSSSPKQSIKSKSNHCPKVVLLLFSFQKGKCQIKDRVKCCKLDDIQKRH